MAFPWRFATLVTTLALVELTHPHQTEMMLSDSTPSTPAGTPPSTDNYESTPSSAAPLPREASAERQTATVTALPIHFFQPSAGTTLAPQRRADSLFAPGNPNFHILHPLTLIAEMQRFILLWEAFDLHLYGFEALFVGGGISARTQFLHGSACSRLVRQPHSSWRWNPSCLSPPLMAAQHLAGASMTIFQAATPIMPQCSDAVLSSPVTAWTPPRLAAGVLHDPRICYLATASVSEPELRRFSREHATQGPAVQALADTGAMVALATTTSAEVSLDQVLGSQSALHVLERVLESRLFGHRSNAMATHLRACMEAELAATAEPLALAAPALLPPRHAPALRAGRESGALDSGLLSGLESSAVPLKKLRGGAESQPVQASKWMPSLARHRSARTLARHLSARNVSRQLAPQRHGSCLALVRAPASRVAHSGPIAACSRGTHVGSVVSSVVTSIKPRWCSPSRVRVSSTPLQFQAVACPIVNFKSARGSLSSEAIDSRRKACRALLPANLCSRASVMPSAGVSSIRVRATSFSRLASREPTAAGVVSIRVPATSFNGLAHREPTAAGVVPIRVPATSFNGLAHREPTAVVARSEQPGTRRPRLPCQLLAVIPAADKGLGVVEVRPPQPVSEYRVHVESRGQRMISVDGFGTRAARGAARRRADKPPDAALFLDKVRLPDGTWTATGWHVLAIPSKQPSQTPPDSLGSIMRVGLHMPLSTGRQIGVLSANHPRFNTRALSFDRLTGVPGGSRLRPHISDSTHDLLMRRKPQQLPDTSVLQPLKSRCPVLPGVPITALPALESHRAQASSAVLASVPHTSRALAVQERRQPRSLASPAAQVGALSGTAGVSRVLSRRSLSDGRAWAGSSVPSSASTSGHLEWSSARPSGRSPDIPALYPRLLGLPASGARTRKLLQASTSPGLLSEYLRSFSPQRAAVPSSSSSRIRSRHGSALAETHTGAARHSLLPYKNAGFKENASFVPVSQPRIASFRALNGPSFTRGLARGLGPCRQPAVGSFLTAENSRPQAALVRHHARLAVLPLLHPQSRVRPFRSASGIRRPFFSEALVKPLRAIGPVAKSQVNRSAGQMPAFSLLAITRSVQPDAGPVRGPSQTAVRVVEVTSGSKQMLTVEGFEVRNASRAPVRLSEPKRVEPLMLYPPSPAAPQFSGHPQLPASFDRATFMVLCAQLSAAAQLRGRASLQIARSCTIRGPAFLASRRHHRRRTEPPDLLAFPAASAKEEGWSRSMALVPMEAGIAAAGRHLCWAVPQEHARESACREIESSFAVLSPQHGLLRPRLAPSLPALGAAPRPSRKPVRPRPRRFLPLGGQAALGRVGLERTRPLDPGLLQSLRQLAPQASAPPASRLPSRADG
eukprot:CAMPEP_0168365430 /NCGR_PEP_ID=MMETSP0228-20121227/4715_1 /TAXON_ID=133427 /ORGANISM="Protoceratium reticulatum, Strain CCCM 535 (=CCMP 1889)" /LENGTH=1367 /DNA_ID=CAMNT_0008378213 /DNA_START=13 /DNA_END=4113 /DNA_ORIENTATION=+